MLPCEVLAQESGSQVAHGALAHLASLNGNKTNMWLISVYNDYTILIM